jgi:hypothetical protein
MYSKFKYKEIALKDISLDDRNPRIITPKKLTSQAKILEYFFEYEDLQAFIKKIAAEGKNHGAELPYVIKSGSGYKVIEGNTRISAYKVLTGLMEPPKNYTHLVPQVSKDVKESMLTVRCSVAPNRETLFPIVVNAHFGRGVKEPWSYLSSRKSIYDEWQMGKSIAKLAKDFKLTPGKVKNFLLEYELYLHALDYKWTKKERNELLDPHVEFNPPVRFLQTSGHKNKVGLSYDTANLEVIFEDAEAKKKFKHLIKKLVVSPEKGLGATATYDSVFSDFGAGVKGKGGTGTGKPGTEGTGKGDVGGSTSKPKPNTLFNYPSTMNNGLVDQLMKEAKGLNCKNFPAAGTFLLRNIIEAILKHIIDEQKANPSGNSLTLATGLDICQGKIVKLPVDDKKVLKEFKKEHLNYLNQGAHGNVIPNPTRLYSARDCIDQFVKRHV